MRLLRPSELTYLCTLGCFNGSPAPRARRDVHSRKSRFARRSRDSSRILRARVKVPANAINYGEQRSKTLSSSSINREHFCRLTRARRFRRYTRRSSTAIIIPVFVGALCISFLPWTPLGEVEDRRTGGENKFKSLT